ncbi:DgyrCDS8437 [Dimorphilus gyrociliatus]|uniref:NAD(+) ADP-ribosyltransferase n=1 Tax=Dimorphilus gyrociliatus TaxID=2664684 RepID=A0A7I8VWG6_9ANNE|nr:DgyrCDS8437 [Dimorphilus gyrociliatus]
MAHIQQLLDACRLGEVNAVLALLNHVDVNASDHQGVTALQMASACGRIVIVRELLARGAALEQANNLGWTPLLHACRRGRLDVADILIANKSNVNARTKHGTSALVLAARGGHSLVVKSLLDAGVETWPQTAVDVTVCEISALMAASQKGHHSVVRLLLDKGADVNARAPSTGVSALSFAALSSNVSCCEILVQRGADPDQYDVNGRTPYYLARHKSVKDYLRQRTDGASIVDDQIKRSEQTLFLQALLEGDTLKVKSFLERNPSLVDITLTQHDGATPLMLAAVRNQTGVAKLLIEYGCNIDSQDSKNGWTALMQATYHNNEDMVRLLLESNANPRIVNHVDFTAFELATMNMGNTEIYRSLAKATDPNSGVRDEAKKRSWKKFLSRVSSRFGSTLRPSSSRLSLNSTQTIVEADRTMSKKEFDRVMKDSERQRRMAEKMERRKIVSAKSMLDLSATPSPASLAMKTWAPAKNLGYKRNSQSTCNLTSIGMRNPNCSPGSSATAVALSGTSSGSSTLTNDRNKRKPLIHSPPSTRSQSSLPLSEAVEHLEDEEDVAGVLRQLSLQSYTPVFEENEVDMEAFLTLNDKDLCELGINESLARNDILSAITRISTRNRISSPC